MANSGAILTDALPEEERRMAIGINAIALVVGSLVGLVLGGVLASSLRAPPPRAHRP